MMTPRFVFLFVIIGLATAKNGQDNTDTGIRDANEWTMKLMEKKKAGKSSLQDLLVIKDDGKHMLKMTDAIMIKGVMTGTDFTTIMSANGKKVMGSSERSSGVEGGVSLYYSNNYGKNYAEVIDVDGNYVRNGVDCQDEGSNCKVAIDTSLSGCVPAEPCEKFGDDTFWDVTPDFTRAVMCTSQDEGALFQFSRDPPLKWESVPENNGFTVNQDWAGCKVAKEGKVDIIVGVTVEGKIWIARDGQWSLYDSINWLALTSTISGIALSSTGSALVVVVEGGALLRCGTDSAVGMDEMEWCLESQISTDWAVDKGLADGSPVKKGVANVAQRRRGNGLGMSYDGQTILVAEEGSEFPDGIYSSKDGGATFDKVTPPTTCGNDVECKNKRSASNDNGERANRGVAVSGDGNTMIVITGMILSFWQKEVRDTDPYPSETWKSTERFVGPKAWLDIDADWTDGMPNDDFHTASKDSSPGTPYSVSLNEDGSAITTSFAGGRIYTNQIDCNDLERFACKKARKQGHGCKWTKDRFGKYHHFPEDKERLVGACLNPQRMLGVDTTATRPSSGYNSFFGLPSDNCPDFDGMKSKCKKGRFRKLCRWVNSSGECVGRL